MKGKILFILFFIFAFNTKSQNSKTTFGLQYKPIIPSAYFNAAELSKSSTSYIFNLNPKYSNSFGMVIRNQINKTFSLESGLNFTQRNFELSITNDAINLVDFTGFGMRSYEFPIQLLTYVRASENWYLNISFGISHNVLASDVKSYGEEKEKFFFQNTIRRSGGYSAILANLGMEYRTDSKGYYYFGTSLHRPWKVIGRIYPEYDDKINIFNEDREFYFDMIGNFVTIDFRYFFKE
jgi:hypothetical protein|tara:strand:+ start:347 stop:1057 length:711 start_codon:yes stop_codon:yes gene_type:complete